MQIEKIIELLGRDPAKMADIRLRAIFRDLSNIMESYKRLGEDNELAWCENCEKYVEPDIRDTPGYFNRDTGDAAPPDWIEICPDCGAEL